MHITDAIRLLVLLLQCCENGVKSVMTVISYWQKSDWIMRCKIAQWQVYTIRQSAKGQHFDFFKEIKACIILRQHESVIHVHLYSAVSNSVHPMDCNLPGSFVHGIFQARILEWVAISLSRGPS